MPSSFSKKEERDRGGFGGGGGLSELGLKKVFVCLPPVMAGSSEKIPIVTAEPEDQHQFMPPVSCLVQDGAVAPCCASP